MAGNNKMVVSGAVYEVTMRAKAGIPLSPALYINLIMFGVLARVQRDRKVDICHVVFMGNHIHLLLVALDPEGFFNFIKELKKGLTDMIKRILGLDFLEMWETSSHTYLPLLEDITERIAYFYTNVAAAGLEDSIEHYPGISSWESFKEADGNVEFETVKECPWITADNIPYVGKGVSKQKDELLLKELQAAAEASHDLVLKPNAWLRGYPESHDDILEINASIQKQVQANEEHLREERQRLKKGVVGANALRNKAPTVSGHKPEKREKRLFIICRDSKLKAEIVARYKAFRQKCYECYQYYRRTLLEPDWPPEAFRPWRRPTVSLLSAL